jgi:hypothetical protein
MPIGTNMGSTDIFNTQNYTPFLGIKKTPTYTYAGVFNFKNSTLN